MEQRTFSYRNRKIAYLESGTGPVLLMLHGWGSSARVMEPLGRVFSGRFRCVIPDLPGFGQSEEPESAWNVDAYADCVTAFIDGLGLGRVHLLCHSFGGRVALKLMARAGATERYGRVLLTGGAGMKPRRKPSYYVRKYTAMALKAPFQVLPEPLKSKGLAWVRTTPAWKMLGSSDYSQLSGVMRETFVKTVSEFLEPCLPAIQNEVFLLWGRRDDSTPVYQAERMEKGIRGAALVVIEEAGHYAFLDQPVQFNAIAKAFFEA